MVRSLCALTGAAFLMILAASAACSLVLGLEEPKDMPGTGGASSSGTNSSGTSSAGGSAAASSSSGQGGADGGICTGDFVQCENRVAEGQPCSCKGSICFIDKCDLTGGGAADGLACKPDPQNLDQLIWTAFPAPLQCCPGNKRPCRSDLKEVCVQTQKPAEVACVTNPCDTGQNLDCQLCASVLCKDLSTACEVKGGIVICSPPP